ncbi:MAG: hypothetical protein HY717_20040 [Planctomycetes bacterium]|nr:hypothetical protein [Planctomycetota bacterium]
MSRRTWPPNPLSVLKPFLGLALILAGCEPSVQESFTNIPSKQELLAKARKYYADRQWDEAIPLLLSLAENPGPDREEIRLLLAYSFGRSGRAQEALEPLLALLEENPFSSAALEELSRDYSRLGREADSRRCLEAAKRIDSRTAHRPGLPEGVEDSPSGRRLKEAMILADRGRAFQALRLFEEVRKDRPRDPLLLGSLGSLYAALHRPREALPLLKEALELGSGLPSAPLLRRHWLRCLAQAEGKEAFLKELGRLAPELASPKSAGDLSKEAIEIHLDELRDPPGAAALLARQRPALSPADTLILGARILIRQGSPEKALEVVLQGAPVLAGSPGEKSASGKDPRRAAVNAFVKEAPDPSEGEALLSLYEGSLGNAAEASEALLRSRNLEKLEGRRREILTRLKGAPLEGAAALYGELADLARTSGRRDDVMRFMEMARGLAPEALEIHRQAVKLFDRPEEVFLRLRALQDVLRLAPDDKPASSLAARLRQELRS